MKWSTNNEYKTMTSANKVLKMYLHLHVVVLVVLVKMKNLKKNLQLVAVLVAQVNKINHLILK